MTEPNPSPGTEPPINPEPESPDIADTAKAAGRVIARLVLWGVIAVSILVVIVLLFLLGPLGLVAVVPCLIVIWLAAALASAGPAAGA